MPLPGAVSIRGRGDVAGTFTSARACAVLRGRDRRCGVAGCRPGRDVDLRSTWRTRCSTSPSASWPASIAYLVAEESMSRACWRRWRAGWCSAAASMRSSPANAARAWRRSGASSSSSLTALVFMLIGLQLRGIVERLEGYELRQLALPRRGRVGDADPQPLRLDLLCRLAAARPVAGAARARPDAAAGATR